MSPLEPVIEGAPVPAVVHTLPEEVANCMYEGLAVVACHPPEHTGADVMLQTPPMSVVPEGQPDEVATH